MLRIVFASRNRHKYREMLSLLEPAGVNLIFGPDLLDPKKKVDVTENSHSYAGNAMKKALEWAGVLGMTTLADDSGLEVRSLDWGPGVISARVAPDDRSRVGWLLRVMEGITDRKARFVAVLAMVDLQKGNYLLAEGTCYGKISLEPSGNSGFGYDPVFVPDGYSRTLASLGSRVKSEISHRSIAAAALCRMLGSGCVVE